MRDQSFDTGDVAAAAQHEADDITNPDHYGVGDTGPEDVSDVYDNPGEVVDLESLHEEETST
ncbi:MAG TPA: hypothetical protein VKG85_01635 [Actinomycetes bacterium]|nr:hypothetical protein [Actinomycetes bacterium]